MNDLTLVFAQGDLKKKKKNYGLTHEKQKKPKGLKKYQKIQRALEEIHKNNLI